VTFDDDFMEFRMLAGPPKRVTLKSVKLEWPPPLLLSYMDFPFRRISYSKITDKQREVMTHVARGSEYEAV
jgi:hypothetical protein